MIPTSIPKAWATRFPGLDLDGDGILDFAATGSNSPFLQYHVDSPDYPLATTSTTTHARPQGERQCSRTICTRLTTAVSTLFSGTIPSHDAQLRLGAYRMEQPTLGLDSDAEYIEGQYQRDWQDLGYVRANHRIKWVKDGIPNTVFNFGSQSSLQQDLLENRDAIDNLTYVEWGCGPCLG